MPGTKKTSKHRPVLRSWRTYVVPRNSKQTAATSGKTKLIPFPSNINICTLSLADAHLHALHPGLGHFKHSFPEFFDLSPLRLDLSPLRFDLSPLRFDLHLAANVQLRKHCADLCQHGLLKVRVSRKEFLAEFPSPQTALGQHQRRTQSRKHRRPIPVQNVALEVQKQRVSRDTLKRKVGVAIIHHRGHDLIEHGN